jgi:two-component system, LytTR family, response regulator
MDLKAIVIDHEPDSAALLISLINKYCSDIVVTGCIQNMEIKEQMIQAHSPDIVFLDTEIPFKLGFDILEGISERNFDVIVIAADNQHAIRAIKYGVLDYLLKPVNVDELVHAVDKVFERWHYKHSGGLIRPSRTLSLSVSTCKVPIPVTDGVIFVDTQDVIRCEASGNYTKIYLTGNKNHLVARSLGEYEIFLTPHNFIRVHHANLVNLSHIEKYTRGEGGHITMSDGSIVDISKRKKHDFLAKCGLNSLNKSNTE